MEKSVSILINNYNYGQFLTQCIQSALDQTHTDVEVIVVDDCSKDNSSDIIAGFSGITAIFQPMNRGQGAAINAGFAKSSGDLVMLLDADDFLYPHAAERLLQHETDGVVQYQHRMYMVDEQGCVFNRYPPWGGALEDGDVRPRLLQSGRYGTTVTSGLAFSRKVLKAVLPMKEADFERCADGYLVTVAPLYGEVRSINEELSAYRVHGSNFSSPSNGASWRIQHDVCRYRVLQQHAKRHGLEVTPEPWRNDPLHLEQRLASLLLNPASHPYQEDKRAGIAAAAIQALERLPASPRLQRWRKAWWLIVGYAPEALAKLAVRWKLDPGARPALVRRLAKVFRAVRAAKAARALRR